MKHSYSYLEQCVETFENVADNAASLEVGDAIGRGSSVTTYSAGSISTSSEAVSVAIKFPYNKDSVKSRLHKELAVAGLLAERVPSLIDSLPKFMAMVTVLGANAVRTGIITEDATRAGLIEVISCAPIAETRRALQGAFVGEKGLMAVFEEKELNGSVFFQAGSTQRILDLTPGPFMWTYERQSADYRRHYAQVAEVYAAGKLSVEVGIDSELAATIPE